MLATGPGFGGEKIQFSNRGDARSLPESERKERLLAPSLDPLKGSDQAGSAADLLLRPGTPGLGSGGSTPSRRQRELLDRRKNWAFDTPEPRDKRRGKADELTERDEESGDSDKKPKTVLERYLERESQASGKATNAPAGAGVGERPDGKGAFTSTPQAGANKSLAPTDGSARFDFSSPTHGPSKDFSGGSPGSGDSRSAGSRLGSELRDRMKEREARMDGFRKLFDAPASVSARSGDGGSPLNEPARAAGASPSGRGFDEFTRRSTFSEVANPARSFNGGVSPGVIGGLTDFSTRSPAAGYAPGFSRQPEPLRVEPKPVVLEIPKRKF
ncbi:MAG: hypothetical protein ACREB3_06495 [Burkholderiales bacterium]